MDEQASITEVPGVSEALKQMDSKGQTLILRNSSVSGFLPSDFLAGYVKRSNLLGFIKGFSDWTVLHLDQVRVAGRGQYMDFTLVPVLGDAVNKYYSVLQGLQPAQSHLGGMLPYGTTFALDMPVASLEQTLELRKLYLDATGGLNKFNTACRSNGPAKWAYGRWPDCAAAPRKCFCCAAATLLPSMARQSALGPVSPPSFLALHSPSRMRDGAL